MVKIFERIKNAGGDWEEESVDWDEEIYDADSDMYYEDVEDSEVYEEESYYEDTENYEDDVVYEDGEFYEGEEVYEDGEVYEDDIVYEDGEFYEGEEVYEDGEVYEDDIVYEDDVVYEDGEVYEDDIVYEDDVVYEDGEFYEDDIVYEDDLYQEDLYGKEESKGGLLAWLGNSSSMDKIMLGAAVCVLLLLVVVSVVLFKNGRNTDYSELFASVGTQLDGIEIVGGEGLSAIEAAVMGQDMEQPTQEQEKDYGEAEYNKSVTIALKTASVQKDLKIKFVNKNSDKLVANVPFSVTVTGPDGKSETWSDDDMDGIIHKKGITPGTYKLMVNTLSGDKYSDYEVPSTTLSAEVKKDIAYEKVDVSDEVKTEAQVDVKKEEQIKQEPVVESVLQDTVEWVESTTVVNTYIEVAKSEITDPLTSAKSGAFLRMSANTDVSGPDVPAVTSNLTISTDVNTVTVDKGSAANAQATAGGAEAGKTVNYTVNSGDTNIATAAVDASGKITITGVNAGQTTVTVTAGYADGSESNTPSATIAVTVKEKVKATVSLDKSTLTVYTGNTSDITATVSEGASLAAKSSDESVATVKVDGKKVVVTGVKAGTATITVTATGENDSASATCAVTIKNNPKNDTATKLKDNAGNQLYVQENGNYREAVYADYYKDGVTFFKKGETKYTGWQTLDGKVYYFDKSGNKVTGEQVIQGAKYNFDSDGVLNNGSAIMGIDVSKYNGNIDWDAVKNSGVSYVIIRCGYRGYTQGSIIIDSKFEQNIKGATNAGLKVGVYFYSQAIDEVEAVEEASFVLDVVKNYKITYPIFLDVEYSGAAGNTGRADGLSKAERTAVCKAFCETIRSGGYTAGVYANKTWLETMLDPNQLSSHKIWLAQYAATPTYTGRYDMWQYKSTGKVSGISGNVDMNLSYLGY